MSDQPQMPSTDRLLSAAVSALGGTRRPGQVDMAKAVTEALEKERHLAVQAGTGTGKSLAYLVPAIRHAMSTGSTVVVSTATLALQRQLIDRDLPRLADALEPLLGRHPTFAAQKGRSNYVCLHKLAVPEGTVDTFDDQERISRLGEQIKRVHEWTNDTDTGDRDELNPGVTDLAWRQVSVTSQECLGATRCPHGEDCFAERAREHAREVDVVVTNHSMLAIDALADIDILPEHDAVIIDEAHELDRRFTSAASNEVSPRGLSMVSKRVNKLRNRSKTSNLESAADDFAAALATEDAGRWEKISQAARTGFVSVSEALNSAYRSIEDSPEGEAQNDPETFAERENLKNLLRETSDSIDRILTVFDEHDPAKHTDVVWLTRSKRGDDTVSVAPLSVAPLLRHHLFGEATAVLTSATLTVGGNFDALAAAWGLPSGQWDGLDAGTPFDPASSGILYTPTHLPLPGRERLSEATLDEMRDLILAAGGRTLGLFSSRRAAEEAAAVLRDQLPFDIYLQGEDSTGVLVEKFANNENSCLFGTLSLWQGVDVPGSSLSLVIIDRIPFPRPDDPLLQARSKAADAAGRSGFMEVSATHAALLMAQGTGRLLRSNTDRGVVAVLDPRLVTKRYGTFLRRSLPAFWPTSDPETVKAALRRLVAASH